MGVWTEEVLPMPLTAVKSVDLPMPSTAVRVWTDKVLPMPSNKTVGVWTEEVLPMPLTALRVWTD